MKIAREVKIGAFLLVTLAFFIWGYNYLKGKDLFKKQLQLYAVYENVGGLLAANPIFLNGLKIGQVQDLYFEGHGSSRIIARLFVSSDIRVPYDSRAIIYSHDIMGARAINLILGNSAVLAKDGDTLISGTEATLQEEVNRQVQPIKKKAEDLLLSLDSVVTTIQTVLDAETRKNLVQSFGSIRQTINNLEHTSYTIDTLVQAERRRMALILANIESVSTNLRNNNQLLSNSIRNISAISDTIASLNLRQTFTRFGTAVDNLSLMLDRLDRGEGSLGKLINDPTLYRELETSSHELNQLLEDIKMNPKRYVHFSIFGRSSKNNPYLPPSQPGN